LLGVTLSLSKGHERANSGSGLLSTSNDRKSS
jgi:hypothetical protein